MKYRILLIVFGMICLLAIGMLLYSPQVDSTNNPTSEELQKKDCDCCNRVNLAKQRVKERLSKNQEQGSSE